MLSAIFVNRKVTIQTSALKSQKLVAVLATFTLVTKKKEEELKWIPCIWYPVTFKNQTETLLDSKSEVNAMSQAFAYQLSLKI